MKTILVTGVSGFIGNNITIRLLNEGYRVVGIDNNNDYYDVSLKHYRLDKIMNNKNFIFKNINIINKEEVNNVITEYKPDIILHLAGYAGVRYSLDHPDDYINSNIIGFYNMLELSKNRIKHFIYASSSSVYGDNTNVPYKEEENTDYPISLYAATKKCDEILAYSYSYLYNLSTTGLRFFTVYGPAGRPDMAYYSFTNKLVNKQNIELYNKGDSKRDFTYIDDVVEAIYRVIDNKPKKVYNIYNVGRSHQYTLIDFVNVLKKEIINNQLLPSDYDFDSKIKLVDKFKSDVYETYADVTNFEKDFNFKPKVSLEEGIKKFVEWYKEYHKGGI